MFPRVLGELICLQTCSCVFWVFHAPSDRTHTGGFSGFTTHPLFHTETRLFRNVPRVPAVPAEQAPLTVPHCSTLFMCLRHHNRAMGVRQGCVSDLPHPNHPHAPLPPTLHPPSSHPPTRWEMAEVRRAVPLCSCVMQDTGTRVGLRLLNAASASCRLSDSLRAASPPLPSPHPPLPLI